MQWFAWRPPVQAPTLVALAWLFAGSACSNDTAPAVPMSGDAGPLGTFASESGGLQLEVHTGPDQPPTRGLSTVNLHITDANSGDAVDGLDLNVVPWMPAMGHGTSIKPAVEADGGGDYVVSRINMYMGGAWDLRIAISGTATDRATLHFTIR